MNRQLLMDGLGWGFLLWLIGYILGIVLFLVVPTSMVGLIIMPVGIFITGFVLLKKIRGSRLQYYLAISIIWVLIAIVFDYFFLVRLFKTADGYYKPDVYIYYTMTFVLPLVVGIRKFHPGVGAKLK